MDQLKGRVQSYLKSPLLSFDSMDVLNLIHDYFRAKKDLWRGLDWHETIYCDDGSEYYFDSLILKEAFLPDFLIEEARVKAKKVEVHALEALSCAEKAVNLAFEFKIKEAYFSANEAYQIECQYHKFAPIWGDFSLLLRKFCSERSLVKI